MVNGTVYANVFKCKSSYVLFCGKNESETENTTNILKLKRLKKIFNYKNYCVKTENCSKLKIIKLCFFFLLVEIQASFLLASVKPEKS
jgi:hypothetical protein